ncbi:hypothetical protein M408DRAFT_10895 [Serendipita vermifera MAFF 305830]|uniref:Uncharacterized protein n=1 Tax=Serendipita vermifera MAFF 305830 TaxID=933852 RepID=A0A0C2WDU0_SERVB|nr:hypothetical protein M408DRAFT_10895 [Serendipita vermifera MAFF 305830]
MSFASLHLATFSYRVAIFWKLCDSQMRLLVLASRFLGNKRPPSLPQERSPSPPQALKVSEPQDQDTLAGIACIHAADQIPVEIWHKILSIAISYPLLPRDDDSYFEYQKVTLFNCETIAMYKACERVRTKLRLVCRSWDQFLDQHSDRLVHLNTATSTGHWPPVKRWNRIVRIEGINDINCECRVPTCWPCFIDYNEPSTWGLSAAPYSEYVVENVKKKHLPLLGSRCQAISHPSIWSGTLLDSVRLNGVTYLAWVGDLGSLSPSSMKISQAYPNLTHLKISISPLYDPSHNFNLPRLRLLSILISHNEPPSPSGQIGYWQLPSLRCLVIVSPRLLGGDVPLDITPLISRIGQPVEEFFFREYISRFEAQQPIPSSTIWTAMPSLKLLGATPAQLSSLTGPGVKRSVDFAIEIAELFSENCARDDRMNKIHLDSLREFCGRILLDKSWHEVSKWLARNAPLCAGSIYSSVEVFDKLNALGYGLCDCRYVSFPIEYGLL